MNKFINSFLPLNPAKTTAIGHSVMSGSRDANPSLSLAIMKCRLAHIRFVSHPRIKIQEQTKGQTSSGGESTVKKASKSCSHCQ